MIFPAKLSKQQKELLSMICGNEYKVTVYISNIPHNRGLVYLDISGPYFAHMIDHVPFWQAVIELRKLMKDRRNGNSIEY